MLQIIVLSKETQLWNHTLNMARHGDILLLYWNITVKVLSLDWSKLTWIARWPYSHL